MCSILPETFCQWCLMESWGQLTRFPVEEVRGGLRLCSYHKRTYLAGRDAVESIPVYATRKSGSAVLTQRVLYRWGELIDTLE